MDALRRVLLCLMGLVNMVAAVFIFIGLINHNLAAQVVDFLDRCLLYNIELMFLQSYQLWLPILIGVLLLALGALVLIIAFYRQKPIRYATVESLDGTVVQISMDAIENVIKRAATGIPQVRSLTTKQRMGNDGLHVALRITVPAEEAIPEVGANVRQAVADELQSMVGLVAKDIRVEVANVVDKPREDSLNGI